MRARAHAGEREGKRESGTCITSCPDEWCEERCARKHTRTKKKTHTHTFAHTHTHSHTLNSYPRYAISATLRKHARVQAHTKLSFKYMDMRIYDSIVCANTKPCLQYVVILVSALFVICEFMWAWASKSVLKSNSLSLSINAQTCTRVCACVCVCAHVCARVCLYARARAYTHVILIKYMYFR